LRFRFNTYFFKKQYQYYETKFFTSTNDDIRP
ncbi:MAG: hypothetical protein RLZZ118_1084, partial [Bacteroidota bacterium]